MTDDRYAQHLRVESNRAVQRAALYAALPAFLGGVAVLAGLSTGALEGVEVVPPWCLAVAAVCLGLSELGRRQRLHGAVAYAGFGLFTSMPTLLFLGTHLTMPSGAATFVTGPISYVYLLCIICTGALMDFRLSTACGLLAAAEYLGVSLLAGPGLQAIEVADPILRQDLVDPSIYALKAMIMGSAGLTVGALGLFGRRLTRQVITEERKKQAISRLFGEYVSEEVRERLLSGAADGERRVVVVLFSDLRGFTTYSEQADPDELVQRLNAYFDEMVDAITSRGGVVDKFIGDAVMAVFDGVLPLEHPEVAAVEAARDMVRRLDALNEVWSAEGRAPFRSGIGVHRGEVVLGTIGSTHRKDFTVIGDAVNTAARLEGLTKEHGHHILVSGAIASALGNGATALGEVPIRGRAGRIEIYAVSPKPCVAGPPVAPSAAGSP